MGEGNVPIWPQAMKMTASIEEVGAGMRNTKSVITLISDASSDSCGGMRKLRRRRRAVLQQMNRLAPTTLRINTVNPQRAAIPPTLSLMRISYLRIPENIELDAAAPLLCAGMTLFSPLQPLERRAGPAPSASLVFVA